jgi:hypothetical protein
MQIFICFVPSVNFLICGGENVEFQFLFSLQVNDHFELSKSLNTMYHYKYFHICFVYVMTKIGVSIGIGTHNILKIINCAYIYEN